jgi:glycosyltransferase involved in cell wall biosynthesis
MRRSFDALRARLRRARFARTPIDAWPVLVGTKLVQTRGGAKLVEAFQRRAAAARGRETVAIRHVSIRRDGGRNVLFVSHCDFTGNSAYHVYAIASELERLGWSPAITVPRNARGVRDLGRPRFHTLSYRDANAGRVRFPDGRGPDIVHAFTPREHVRNVTLAALERYGCRYVVHLEDSETAVQSAVVGGFDAGAVSSFVEGAAGMTVIVDRLLELKPESMPGVVVWPGYDDAIDRPGRSRSAIRRDIGLTDNQVAIVYPGNIHEANLAEVTDLYEAVETLRRRLSNVVLVKSGWNRVASGRLPRLASGVIDLGWISRRRVPELLRAADVLVQPGAPGPFNDYRFPSKLPEFLASGQPVVLPRTNIGLHLVDGAEAVLLERGDAAEIGEKTTALLGDPALRGRIGEGGRAFAHEKLRWATNVHQVVRLYEQVATGATSE